jgi:hypothetical protein
MDHETGIGQSYANPFGKGGFENSISAMHRARSIIEGLSQLFMHLMNKNFQI